MPRIFRSMKRDSAGKPIVGRSATALGVRMPRDIAPDANGMVQPATGGMSVGPKLQLLPPHLIPARLQHLVVDARGKNDLCVWVFGDGPFVAGAVAPCLQLQPDRPEHGTVQPDQPMPLLDYETALADTRDAWVINETGS